jgi:hypothetical protein
MFDLKSLDPAKVTYPTITSPGVRFKKAIIIPLDEIYVQPQENNPVRVETKNAYHIQKLTVNLSNGIDYGRMPPAVRENPRIVDGKHYRYELMCGHHRFEAFMILGYTYWIFWVYEICQDGYSYEDSVRTLQVQENDHDASLASEAQDVSSIIVRLIEHGSKLVKNEESSIRNYVDTYCKNMHYNTRGKVIRQVMDKVGTYRQVVTYTAQDAYKWIHNHTDYTYAGELDTKRKKFGWTVLEGYEYEFLVSAMKKYRESGKESYFILHTKAPTAKNTLDDKREKMIESFNHLEDSLKEVFTYYQENNKFPWSIECFMPQDQSTEDSKKPVIVQ